MEIFYVNWGGILKGQGKEFRAAAGRVGLAGFQLLPGRLGFSEAPQHC